MWVIRSLTSWSLHYTGWSKFGNICYSRIIMFSHSAIFNILTCVSRLGGHSVELNLPGRCQLMNHQPSLKNICLNFFLISLLRWFMLYKKGFPFKLKNYLSFQCSGPSMEPTIQNSDVVFAENLSRHFYGIQR